MTAEDDRYAPASEADVTRLVIEHPLAWVVSTSADEWRATPLPLRPVIPPGEGRPIEALIGHFARSNPQVALVRRQPRALILFMGVQGYVSPSWLADRAQAPTWNYATAQYLVELELTEGEPARDAALADLVGAMEAGRPSAWSSSEMGARYRSLARSIVAFRARVLERRVRFKLGQDERADVYADILWGLDRTGSAALGDWMRRSNPGRQGR